VSDVIEPRGGEIGAIVEIALSSSTTPSVLDLSFVMMTKLDSITLGSPERRLI
jgi:hypothetical protein